MSSTKERYTQDIEAICDGIRQKPHKRPRLSEVADSINVSPVRFHQLFAHIKGENYGAFMRRVQLEYSCSLLRDNPDWPLTKIAMEAGFSESSAFSRAFKQAYSIAPNRWDRITPLNTLQQPSSSEPSFSSIPQTIESTVFHKMIPMTCYATYKVSNAINSQVLSEAFDRMEEFLRIKDQFRPDRCFHGFTSDSVLDTPPDKIVFELAYPIDTFVTMPYPFIRREMPQTPVAAVHCEGGPAEFIQAWDFLLRQVLPGSESQRARLPLIEKYLDDPRQTDMKVWNMYCYVPLKTKGETND